MTVGGPPLLVVITGPTAVGKTDVGIEVALALNGEVVSADSMMVYRGMDIGTAKPSLAERRGVPHHLIDVADPDEHFTVARYQELASAAIKDIQGRSRLPLLVGGTGLYIRAVIDRYRFPVQCDPDLRSRLQDEARLFGSPHLHGRLAAVDPATAARLHPNDQRRIIRALEVFIQTGTPLSRFLEHGCRREPQYRLAMFGLSMPRVLLYRRIEKRVDELVQAGLVEEVRGLLAQGYGPELVAMKGLGYKEMVGYLRGNTTLEEAVNILKRNTRRFAKRQFTWFRRDDRICWLDLNALGGTRAAAREIVGLLAGVA